VAILHAAALRPLVGVSVASLLLLCALGHAPKAARFLGCELWRPLAGLSYSMYLLQFIVMRQLEKPFLVYVAPGLPDDAPLWLVAVVAYVAAALLIVGCLPLALLNYTFVERPGVKVGKWVVARLTQGASKSRGCTVGQKFKDVVGKLGSEGADEEGAAENPADVEEGEDMMKECRMTEQGSP